jgi:hypothetical protein
MAIINDLVEAGYEIYVLMELNNRATRNLLFYVNNLTYGNNMKFWVCIK